MRDAVTAIQQDVASGKAMRAGAYPRLLAQLVAAGELPKADRDELARIIADDGREAEFEADAKAVEQMRTLANDVGDVDALQVAVERIAAAAKAWRANEKRAALAALDAREQQFRADLKAAQSTLRRAAHKLAQLVELGEQRPKLLQALCGQLPDGVREYAADLKRAKQRARTLMLSASWSAALPTDGRAAIHASKGSDT